MELFFLACGAVAGQHPTRVFTYPLSLPSHAYIRLVRSNSMSLTINCVKMNARCCLILWLCDAAKKLSSTTGYLGKEDTA